MLKRRRKGPVYWGQTGQGEIKKSAHRALISGMVLFMVALAAGSVYTYYMDKNASPKSASFSAAVSSPPQEIRHVKPPANAAVGAAVEAFSAIAKPGEDASISVRSTPGATCKIEVLYNHVKDTDPGLKPQITDDFGGVTWDWTVSPAAPTGMWPVNVTCARNGKSGFVQAQLDVSS